MKHRKRYLCVLVLLTFGVAGCDMTRHPKDSYVKRVQEVCGPRIAHEYSITKWKDRDYAQDSFLITCILFPNDTREAGKKEVN